jgi:hypothetical protein
LVPWPRRGQKGWQVEGGEAGQMRDERVARGVGRHFGHRHLLIQ